MIGVRRAMLVAAWSAALALLLTSCSDRQSIVQAPDPNVLLIVIDSLRADHLGAYGYQLNTSPHIDELAADGALFENAITPSPWTRPAMASLLTSLYPHVHGATIGRTLPAEVLTLAESLQARYYRTVEIQTNPFIQGKNFAQGFATYSEIIEAAGEQVVNAFLRWLDQDDRPRFFAYLHFMDVHLPYWAPEAYRKRFVRPYTGVLRPDQIRIRKQVVELLPRLTDSDKRYIVDLYDAGVSHADDLVGLLLEELKRRGVLDKTIIVLTADHGEELFDHGGFEHGHSLLREVVHVPLVIRNPRVSAKGVRINQLVRLIDVFPTILDFIGVEIPPFLMGRSLTPALTDPTADWNLEGFSEGVLYGPFQSAVEKGRFKVVRIEPPGTVKEAQQLALMPPRPGWSGSGLTEFYDLEHDPGERHPLTRHPMEGRLLQVLNGERTTVSDVRITAAPETMTKEQMEQLRSLGYLR